MVAVEEQLPLGWWERVVPRGASIEQDVNLDPRASTFGKGVRKFAADRAGPIDEGLERDGRFGGADCVQHRWEDLVTVQKCIDPIAIQNARAEKCAHRARKLRISRPVKTRDRLFNDLFAARCGASRYKQSEQRFAPIPQTNRSDTGHCGFLLNLDELVVVGRDGPARPSPDHNAIKSSSRSSSERQRPALG